MLNTSYEFERLIAANSKVYVKATITFADGTVLDIEGDDFMQGGVSFDDAVSSSNSFDVGAAIINQCTVTLNNYDDRFSQYDFTGAKIEPYIGVMLSTGRIEWLKKGVFWTEQPSSYPSTISLTALDNMSKFERDYGEVTTRYPATLRTIAQDICTKFDITLAKTNFVNYDYSVPNRPTDDALTCLEVIGAVAQCAGCWARIDNQGRLLFDWYDTTKFEEEDWLDGGVYDEATTSYATGDAADGGSFTDYTNKTGYEGGSFENRGYALVHGISSSTIITDDVVITGFQVTALEGAANGETVEGETKLFGSEGYVLAISDNPLIPYGKASEVATRVGQHVVGMRFRPFDISAIGSPAYEAGDPILIVDAKQNIFRSYITSLKYKAGSYEMFACNAKTPSRNSASGYSAATKNIIQLRNELKKETTAREQAIANLANKIGANAGMFMTVEVAANGGKVYYMHDQTTVEQSQYVWKMTADAIAISVDGGKTYSYGLDVDGNAILERIYTVGLDADYIATGAIEVKKGSTTMFKADYDTGDVYINAESLSIDVGSIGSQIDAAKAHYGYCSTAAGTRAKVVTCTNFKLYAGAVICVQFAYSNTVSSPTLNVNGTGARSVYIYGSTLASDYYWAANDVITFVYDGSGWRISDAGALSRIKATQDEISLTVSNLQTDIAGTYATKSQLTATANSITAEVSSYRAHYATCSTYGDTQAKVAYCSGFTLYAGAMVSVRFTYANTVSSPTLNVNNTGARTIYQGNSTITGSNGWKAYDVVTFVYDGSYWRVSDSGANAKIQIAQDSIDLKVSKGSVSSQLSIESGSVAINSNRFSWSSTYSSMSSTGKLTCTSGTIGGFTISAYSIYNNSITMDSYGIELKNGGTNVGKIGTNSLQEDGSKKGLDFDLNESGAYMTWAAKARSSDSFYAMKWSYANKYLSIDGGTWNSGRLHAGCDIDMHYYTIQNGYMDSSSGASDGITYSSSSFILPTQMYSDGRVARWSSGCYLGFRRGFLVRCALP